MKLTKKLTLAAYISCVVLSLPAENCEVHLMAIPVEQGEDVPSGINDNLITRLTNAITASGVSADTRYDNFFVTGKFNHITQDVVPGPPSQVALHTQFTVYIGDLDSEKVFASRSFDLRGVGTSEQRAFINALRSINGSNRELVKFVEEGKKKIINYFDNNYKQLLTKARTVASQRKYEEALSIATSIPECCKGYSESSKVVLQLFQEYVDFDGTKEYDRAKAIWASNPTADGAEQAFLHLNRIDPDSKCYPKAVALAETIGKTVKSDYDFENRKKYQDSVDLEQRRIDSARAVGVAFGNGQQPKTTNITWLH